MRQTTEFCSIFLFDIFSIVIFSIAVVSGTTSLQMPLDVFVVEFWIITFFSVIFLISKLFLREKEAGTFQGLAASPLPGSTLMFAKIFFAFILATLVELILFGLGIIISNPAGLNLTIPVWIYLTVAIFLPTLDLSVSGVLVSAFSMYTRNRSFLLPILYFPLILPVISPIIGINVQLLQGAGIASVMYEFLFLLFHVAVMMSVMVLVSDYVLRA